MTISEARGFGQPAYSYLTSGALLRYDPLDDAVRLVAYPVPPRDWREAPYFLGALPDEGWRHLAGCTCAVCAREWDRTSSRSREVGR